MTGTVTQAETSPKSVEAAFYEDFEELHDRIEKNQRGGSSVVVERLAALARTEAHVAKAILGEQEGKPTSASRRNLNKLQGKLVEAFNVLDVNSGLSLKFFDEHPAMFSAKAELVDAILSIAQVTGCVVQTTGYATFPERTLAMLKGCLSKDFNDLHSYLDDWKMDVGTRMKMSDVKIQIAEQMRAIDKTTKRVTARAANVNRR